MRPAETGPKILAAIPARGGSKGIPGKNLRPLGGKPLLTRAIELARAAGVFGRVLVTTDSEAMAALARQAGAEAPFLRPADLARDDTPMLPVVQHAVRYVMAEGWSPDIVVLLQPTAPFRRVDDLGHALDLLQSSPGADSVVSVEEIPSHYSPHYAMKVETGKLLPFLPEGARVTRRQDAPKAYTRNGQFYVMRRTTLLEQNSFYGRHCLPFVTAHKAVNLDTPDDWAEAERLAGGLS
jgi:N-acylneuraminate cytidylyltransferase